MDSEHAADHSVPPEVRRVFISHLHRDDDAATELRALLRHGLGPVAVSLILDRDDVALATTEAEIQHRILIPRLKWCGVILVLLTQGTESSRWVRWEVDYGWSQGKRIVGVTGPLAEPHHGLWLKRLGHPITDWDQSKILDLVFAPK